MPLLGAPRAQDRDVRFAITHVGDTTLTFQAGKMTWVVRSKRAIVVDPRRNGRTGRATQGSRRWRRPAKRRRSSPARRGALRWSTSWLARSRRPDGTAARCSGWDGVRPGGRVRPRQDVTRGFRPQRSGTDERLRSRTRRAAGRDGDGVTVIGALRCFQPPQVLADGQHEALRRDRPGERQAVVRASANNSSRSLPACSVAAFERQDAAGTRREPNARRASRPLVRRRTATALSSNNPVGQGRSR